MTRRNCATLGHGVIAGVVLSLSGAAVLAALGPTLDPSSSLRLVVALLGLAYVIYVMWQSRERVGRVATLVLWAVAAVGTWLAGLPLAGFVLVHVGLVWLVRSLYFYSGVLPALVDFALTALGVVFAVWAAGRSHSAVLAFWCFFLAQAFHALIPAAIAGRSAAGPSADDGRFESARRAANAAVRRLSEAR